MRWILIGLLLPVLAGCTLAPNSEDAELAGLVSLETLNRGKGTPAEFAANQVGLETFHHARGVLLGEEPGSREQARRSLAALRDEIERGLNWPRERESIRIPKLKEAPEIDGKLDDPAWSRALVLSGEFPIGGTEKTPNGTVWKLGYTDTFLYAAAFFPGPHDSASVPGAPWQGDALELFVGTGVRFRAYWELILPPDNRGYTVTAVNNRWGKEIVRDAGDEHVDGLRTAVASGPDGYSLEIAFPWRELPAYVHGNPPKSGEEFNLMLIRCRGGKQSACRPILYGGHNIFGHLRAFPE